MIPAAFAGVETQLLVWMLAMVRPGAAFLAAPLFGAPQVPVQLRLVLALAIGVPAAATGAVELPAAGMVSLAGLVIVAMEVVVGVALGLALQIGFAAAMIGGELISNSMGLGFAAMANPLGGPATPAISQLMSMLALFLLLALDGHLMLAGFIVESYRALPVGDAWLAADTLRRIAGFGSLVFASGLAIALPVGFALVLVQIVMAFIARSAPTLNLFAVGLPATLAAGLVLMAAAMPVIADAVAGGLRHGLDEAARIAGHG